MIYPNEEKFYELKKKSKMIPVSMEISGDTETPITIFQKLSHGNSYLLESVESGERWGRYSFIGRDPFLTVKSYGEEITVVDSKGIKTFKGKVIDEIQRIIKDYSYPLHEDLPDFSGGAVGYIAYDIVQQYHDLHFKNEDDIQLPDLHLLFTKEIVVYDHIKQKILIIVNSTSEENYNDAVEKIVEIKREIETPLLNKEKIINYSSEGFKSNETKESFMEKVEKIKEEIAQGNSSQIVISQRFQTKTNLEAFEAYRGLRSLNPSPYMYYMDFIDYQIVGSSPEILVKVKGGEVETCPIAGTRPRGKTKEEDLFQEKDLLEDPKEIKEHLMLIDLAKEDLEKFTEEGSIRLTEFKKVKRYSHVMHIVSHLKGKLKIEMNSIDAFIHCFPAGTVSGAPKLRAMKKIEELENVKRGIYAGAAGYIGFNGNLDMAIAIRTIIFKERMAYVQAGAGIVADSEAEKEYMETVNKAKALLTTLEVEKEKSLTLSKGILNS